MKSTKEQLLQIQEKLNDLIDSDASLEDAIQAMNEILKSLGYNIQHKKDFVGENERILNEWCKKFVEDRKDDEEYKGYKIEDFFAKDGIMNIGNIFKIDDNGTIWREASGKENIMWHECPLRVLFLTKDENTGGNEAWDVRQETFYAKGYGLPPHNKTISDSFFYQNEACLLYGLLNTKPHKMIKFDDFSWECALMFPNDNIFARINCKKEVGYSTIKDGVLIESIDKYYDYLKEQILNIDADIFVCCGSQNDNNIILNTVYDIYENEFEYMPCVEGKGTGMHYNAKRNKLVIDAYHLAFFKGGVEARYNETVGMYFEFLKYLKKTEGIDFSASHR